MSQILFAFATYLALAAAIWTLFVLTLGGFDLRRQRDLDILHALDDLRREVAALRSKISNNRP